MGAMPLRAAITASTTAFALAAPAGPQPAPDQDSGQTQEPRQALDDRFDETIKAIDDAAWFERVGDVAGLDKWRIAGSQDANLATPTAPVAGLERGTACRFQADPHQYRRVEDVGVIEVEHFIQALNATGKKSMCGRLSRRHRRARRRAHGHRVLLRGSVQDLRGLRPPLHASTLALLTVGDYPCS